MIVLALWVACVRAEPADPPPPTAPASPPAAAPVPATAPADLPPAEPQPPATPREPVTPSATVLFLDPDGSRREVPAADLPDSIAWYTAADGTRTPCARVEATRRGTALEIKRYGADGALLDTTMSSPRR